MDVYDNLKQLGIELPEPPPKGGIYTPVKQVGNLLYTAGQGTIQNGEVAFSGKMGQEILDIQIGQQAAKICAINMLSALHVYLGDLNKIKNVVKILGFVASSPAFYEQAKVMNGCSQFLGDVFGERGAHARSAIGTNVLPLNMTVEVEGIFEI